MPSAAPSGSSCERSRGRRAAPQLRGSRSPGSIGGSPSTIHRSGARPAACHSMMLKYPITSQTERPARHTHDPRRRPARPHPEPPRLHHPADGRGDGAHRAQPIFSQAHDFTCFVCGPDGWLVSQGGRDPDPLRWGRLRGARGAARLRGRHRPRRCLCAQRPLAGRRQPPARLGDRAALFVGDRRVAFACNRAHQSDIGGGAPGAYNPRATDTWQEGVRLPP